MNFLRKNMGGIYTILGSMFQIAAIICFAMVYYSDKKKDSEETIKPISTPTNTYNIKGDFVNRDKNTIDKSKETQRSQKKISDEKVGETIINNGIINSGINNGNQTVHNVYNEKPPRKINDEDISTIQHNIPLDYKINFLYVNSTEESVNYANEVFSAIKEMGYDVKEVMSIGMYSDGKPYKRDGRIDFNINKIDKSAEVIIKEQK